MVLSAKGLRSDVLEDGDRNQSCRVVSCGNVLIYFQTWIRLHICGVWSEHCLSFLGPKTPEIAPPPK